MHNTKIRNIEFNIAWCETNLRYWLGDPNPDIEKIAYMRSEIERLNKLLAELRLV